MNVFHPYFIYIDQYLEIMPQSIQSVLVTSAFMMVVSFIMIPNPLCSLWVAFSIMSIEVGNCWGVVTTLVVKNKDVNGTIVEEWGILVLVAVLTVSMMVVTTANFAAYPDRCGGLHDLVERQP